MEIPSVLSRKSPHKVAEENPEKIRTAEFWNRIKPVEFVEENPKHALKIAGDAIESGLTHTKIDETVSHAIRAHNFQDVAIHMGAHKSKRIAKYLIEQHMATDPISNPQLARTLADVAPPEKTVEVIAQIADPQIRRELLARHKRKILSDKNAVKTIAKYPQIIEHILEAEWHADMDEKQLKLLSAALSRESPAEMARTIANTLRNDIHTSKSAKNTVILLRNIMSGAAGDPRATEGLLEVYQRIKSHVFTPEGKKNIEFGKTFLRIGGEDTIAFLAKAASQKHNRGDYESAADIAGDAVWLAKEYLKHVQWKNAEKNSEVKDRAGKYMQALVKLVDPTIYGNIDYRKRRMVKQQLRRLMEELSQHEIMQHANSAQLRDIGSKLASLHDHSIILPMLKVIAENPNAKNHAVIMKAYLSAHSHKDHQKNAFQELLEQMEQENGRELSDKEIRNIIHAINVRNYIPNALWRKYGK